MNNNIEKNLEELKLAETPEEIGKIDIVGKALQGTIDDRLKVYVGLQEKIKELEEEMDELKYFITEELKNYYDNKYMYEGITAQVVDKETYKYNDEMGMINWCKANNYGYLVKETIVARSMNSELKKNVNLNESLKDKFTKTTTSALTVKKVI